MKSVNFGHNKSTNKSQMVFRKDNTSAEPISEENYANQQFWSVTFHRAAQPWVEEDEGVLDNVEDIRGLLVQAVEIYEQIMDMIANRDKLTFDRVVAAIVDFIDNYGKDEFENGS